MDDTMKKCCTQDIFLVFAIGSMTNNNAILSVQSGEVTSHVPKHNSFAARKVRQANNFYDLHCTFSKQLPNYGISSCIRRTVHIAMSSPCSADGMIHQDTSSRQHYGCNQCLTNLRKISPWKWIMYSDLPPSLYQKYIRCSDKALITSQ